MLTDADNCDDGRPSAPLWREAQESPKLASLRRDDAATLQRLIANAAGESFAKSLVMREINELSYRDIATAVGVPVGTVMSRLARARTMLRDAWRAQRVRWRRRWIALNARRCCMR